MAIETHVSARWERFIRDIEAWDAYDNEPNLRASVGAQKVTVWLPSGKRVVMHARTRSGRRMPLEHYWRDRFCELRRIVFTLK